MNRIAKRQAKRKPMKIENKVHLKLVAIKIDERLYLQCARKIAEHKLKDKHMTWRKILEDAIKDYLEKVKL